MELKMAAKKRGGEAASRTDLNLEVTPGRVALKSAPGGGGGFRAGEGGSKKPKKSSHRPRCKNKNNPRFLAVLGCSCFRLLPGHGGGGGSAAPRLHTPTPTPPVAGPAERSLRGAAASRGAGLSRVGGGA